LRSRPLPSTTPVRSELWLLDEPHAGLDSDGRDVIDDLMREAASVGATVLFASHELDRATGVAHRSVTVAGGVVIDDVAPTAPSRDRKSTRLNSSHVK